MTRGLVPERVSARLSADRRLAFTFTPRTVRLLIVGLVFVIPAALDRRLLLAMGIWDVAVIAAWLIDLRALPQPEALAVARLWTAPLTLGVPQQIRITVSNDSDRAIAAAITDLPHSLLRAVPSELPIDTPGHATAAATYEVTPA